MQSGVGGLAFILIALFLWESRWKGRVVILTLVAISLLLHRLGDDDSVYLFDALGFAMRVAIACVYLIWRRLPDVS
jgi:hypothetical protein